MQVASQIIATLSAGLFAGAAVYINWAEHPARMRLDTRHAALQWAPSYKRATTLQAPLAVIGLIAGLLAWYQGAGTGWLVAGLMLGAVVPFTLIVIMPTNKRLLDPARDLDSAETRDLLSRWERLHTVRSGLGLAAFVLAVCLMGSQNQ
jgi:hypothetical protein